ncbi:uncharacterized protein LOC114020616 isoform X20 [Chelonia mydas]|uniref:uncharacterized protein LOC114020616 isoform X20 n=1 Tax=Chelonia mydas TaxID=8469 RepID=UPI0018A1D4E9|nr:uncharacterized protein LOC114020616 isoform X20 [Chelonia mydas]
MRFREPPPPARELWRSARARPTLSLTHGAVGVWARPERRDATQRNASPAPPFPAHRCSACALDQLFPSCPGCYKFSLPHFCPSFSSERAALQAAHACPQGEDLQFSLYIKQLCKQQMPVHKLQVLCCIS